MLAGGLGVQLLECGEALLAGGLGVQLLECGEALLAGGLGVQLLECGEALLAGGLGVQLLECGEAFTGRHQVVTTSNTTLKSLHFQHSRMGGKFANPSTGNSSSTSIVAQRLQYLKLRLSTLLYRPMNTNYAL